jgi:integrase-like protein
VRKPRAAPRCAVRPIAPLAVEAMRGWLIDDGRTRDAVLVCVLAYAGVRPQEALALRWRHVRERTLLVEAALADGVLKEQKTGRPPRTVDLLAPLRHDLVAWRLASTSPGDSELLFPTADGQHWREHDYRNWRKRVFQPTAQACGVGTTRPYDLRHSFASLLIHEGRCSVVELAAQLGHAPTMTLNTYAHVIAELREGPRLPAAERIRSAREQVAAEKADPIRTPQLQFDFDSDSSAQSPAQKKPRTGEAFKTEPSLGLEPRTPSLPWKCSTTELTGHAGAL